MHQYVYATLSKCTGFGCKSSAIIDAIIPSISVNIVILNSYLDFNDYNTPVKSYFDDRILINTVKSFTKYIKVYAKLNTATLNDDYLKIQSPTTKQFFNTDKIVYELSDNDSTTIMQTAIFVDSNRGNYQRTVFSILDLLGLVGGIFGLLQVIN